MRKRERPSPDRADVIAQFFRPGASPCGQRRGPTSATDHRQPEGEGLVRPGGREDTSSANRLDQLFARSRREIEAHATEVAATETGRYYIDEAAHLLAGLRLWAQSQYRSDQVIREILEAADPTTLQNVARELRNMKTREGLVASWSVEAIAKWPAAQLVAVASYVLRAL